MRPRRFRRLFLSWLVILCCSGCVSRGASLDPEVRWRQAERRLGAVVESLEDVRLLRNDYDAVILLDHSGELRGRALARLAELDLGQKEYESARANLEQALRAGVLSPPTRPRRFSCWGTSWSGGLTALPKLNPSIVSFCTNIPEATRLISRA